MKKIQTIFLALICLISFSYSANLYTNLLDFMFLVSKYNNVRIISDDGFDTSSYHFIYNSDDKLSIDEFKEILKQKNLYLYHMDNIYIVSDKSPVNDTLHSITLENFLSSEITPILGLYDLNTTYSANTNTIHFISSYDTYNQVKKASKEIDKLPQMASFKLVITETNLKNVRDRGADLVSLLKPLNRGDLSLYVNLLTAPYLNNTNIIKNNSQSYFGVLNFLDNNGLTKIISSPFITAFNNTEVSFSSVNTIPYLISSSETTSTQTSSTSSYDYKDVGLKISLKPTFLNGGIKIDLHLIIEDVLNSNTLTPTTSKKEIKSSYFLQRGEILVLSGINKQTNQTIRNGIPILKDIWLLKYLFSVEQDIKTDNILTLSLEVI